MHETAPRVILPQNLHSTTAGPFANGYARTHPQALFFHPYTNPMDYSIPAA